MQSKLNPYIEFSGNARQAMTFYQTVFGGKLAMQTYKDFQISKSPADDDKIMHAELIAENGITLMGADSMDEAQSPKANISISLSGDQQTELTGYYNQLSAGGTIFEPLAQAPWGDQFGMCADRFGIKWMFNIAGPKA